MIYDRSKCKFNALAILRKVSSVGGYLAARMSDTLLGKPGCVRDLLLGHAFELCVLLNETQATLKRANRQSSPALMWSKLGVKPARHK